MTTSSTAPRMAAVMAAWGPPLRGGGPRLRRVLRGRVGDGGALLTVGDDAGDGAGDDDGIVKTHTGTTPCRFQGRSTRLFSAISRPRQIVRRVSRGSMTSSMRSLPAAM